MVDFVVKILRILTNKIQNKILVQKDLQYSETHTKKKSDFSNFDTFDFITFVFTILVELESFPAASKILCKLD